MKSYYSKNRKQRMYRWAGYTLIEVIMVIAVVGIIATISYVSYINFRHNLVVSVLKSDLSGAASAMENERNFGSDGYPIAVPSTFTPSDNVSLTGGSTDAGESYCVEAVSSEEPSMYYYIDSLMDSQGAQVGSCVSSRPIPQNLAATIATSTSLNITWDAVSNAGSYTLQQDISSDFSSPTPFTLTTNSYVSGGLTTGINYYYRVNATVASATGGWSEMTSANTSVPPPTTPSVDVAYSAPNVVATASSATCSTGTVQYLFSSQINEGSWIAGTWSSLTSASQSALEGAKYDYKVQARCYIDADTYSSAVESAEDTYTNPFTSVPATPTVSASTPDSTTTNFSWNATSCPSGTSARYQYDFTTTYGYDSGWQSTAATSASFTTASAGYTYTLQVKTQCYTAYSQSTWSGVGSANYTRPYTVTTLIVAGGGGGGGGDSYGNGGGGGGGGVIYTSYNPSPQAYGVTIGGGGCGCACSTTGGGTNGGNSGWGPYVAIGGGGGGGGSSNQSGKVGGCGGGASGSSSTARSGAAGTAGQGYGGGNSCSDDSRGSGGGGGAGSAGGANAGCSNNGTNGGAGVTYSISGVSTQYAGGGGGGVGSGTVGIGQFGGGDGNSSMQGHNGVNGTGGGGGGGKCTGSSGEGTALGGSGVVIIRHATGAFSASGGNSVYTSGTDTIRVFTSSGTFTIN